MFKPRGSIRKPRRSIRKPRRSIRKPCGSIGKLRRSIMKPRGSMFQLRRSIMKPCGAMFQLRRSIMKPRRSMFKPRGSIRKPCGPIGRVRRFTLGSPTSPVGDARPSTGHPVTRRQGTESPPSDVMSPGRATEPRIRFPAGTGSCHPQIPQRTAESAVTAGMNRDASTIAVGEPPRTDPAACPHAAQPTTQTATVLGRIVHPSRRDDSL